MLIEINSEQSSVKKYLPKGACVIDEVKKHEYIKKFIPNPFSYRFILPVQSQFSPFVVIKTKQDKGNPIFKMYFHHTKCLLLSAQQQNMTIGCNYVICNSEVPSKNNGFVGKLRGNFSGDEFQIYDGGDNPDRVKSRPRKHLGAVKKEESSLWSGNKKEVKIYMVAPKPQESKVEIEGVGQYQPLDFTCTEKNSNPLAKQEAKTDHSTELLKHVEGGPDLCYLKTFILQSSIHTQALVMRQRSETYFELEIGCPLTFLQGFGYLLALVEIFGL